MFAEFAKERATETTARFYSSALTPIMTSPEENSPLHPSPPQSPVTPRRPSSLTPFASKNNGQPVFVRRVSEESRTLGRLSSPTQGQGSPGGLVDVNVPRSSTSSTTLPIGATINPNPGTHALRPPRPTSNSTISTPSMILYQLAVPGLHSSRDDELVPPKFPSSLTRPGSVNSRESVFTMSSDSKYPSYDHAEHGYVAYAYEPALDEEEEELVVGKPPVMSWRGMMNLGMLLIIVFGLIALFVGGPVVDYLSRDDDLYSNREDSSFTETAIPKVAGVRQEVDEPTGELQRRYPIPIAVIRA